MQIDIAPEHIDQLVRDKIMEAAIGKNITTMIGKVLGAGSYNNPVEGALREVISGIVRDLLCKEYRPQIEAAVRAEIEKRVTADIVNKYADATIAKIILASEDR